MKKIMILILLCLIIPIVNAEVQHLGTVKQGDCITLPQTCSNCTYVNISAITYPNKTTINNEWKMTKSGIMFNYSYCNTNILGQYIVDGHGDIDGIDTAFGYDFEVTGNGKTAPNGVVISLFAVAFLIIVGFALYEFIVSLGHFASLDLDVIDLAKSIGTYFALFGVYELSLFYLGNPQIESLLVLFIQIGAFTHILVPLTGFLISITVGSLRKKTIDFGTKRIYRRQKIG